jgi:hypothetical protein
MIWLCDETGRSGRTGMPAAAQPVGASPRGSGLCPWLQSQGLSFKDSSRALSQCTWMQCRVLSDVNWQAHDWLTLGSVAHEPSSHQCSPLTHASAIFVASACLRPVADAAGQGNPACVSLIHRSVCSFLAKVWLLCQDGLRAMLGLINPCSLEQVALKCQAFGITPPATNFVSGVPSLPHKLAGKTKTGRKLKIYTAVEVWASRITWKDMI